MRTSTSASSLHSAIGAAPRHPRWVSALAALLAVNSGCDEVDLPEGPDLRPLARTYETPDGHLASNLSKETIDDVNDALELLRKADTANVFGPTVEAALVQLRRRLYSTGGVSTQASDLDVDAVVNVERRCDGWGTEEEELDVAAAGSLTLTGLIRDSRIDQVLWGSARNCRLTSKFEGDRYRVALDGQVALFMANPVAVDVLAQTFVVRAGGTLTVEGESLSGDFDFRVNSSRLEVRVSPKDVGNIIFAFNAAGFLSARTADNSYTCDVLRSRCWTSNQTTAF